MKKIMFFTILGYMTFTVNAQDPTSSNPNNSSAFVHLSWLNDVARIRVGGSGTGASNGLDIQGTGNNSLLRLRNDGRIGIGINNPAGNLEMYGNSQRFLLTAATQNLAASSRIEFWENRNGIGNAVNAHFAIEYDGLNDALHFRGLYRNNQLNKTLVTIKRDGGLYVPGGGVIIDTGLDCCENSLVLNRPTEAGYLALLARTGNENKWSLGLRSNQSSFIVYDEVAAKNRMVFTPNGSVGIGSDNPPSGYLLAVAGKAIMEEIKVEASPWPDYVFSEDYQLPSLAETEIFIKQNKHLPGIPSADEVAENGIELGDMNARLLEKIEELTLHQIELMKLLQAMQSENDAIKARLKALEVSGK